MFKIKMYNKCFDIVCNENPSRLNWGMCVTNSFIFLSVKKEFNDKRKLRRTGTAPHLQRTRQSFMHPWPPHSV